MSWEQVKRATVAIAAAEDGINGAWHCRNGMTCFPT